MVYRRKDIDLEFVLIIPNYLQILTAITDQMNHKKTFESVALQHFQKFSQF
jgi:hypothetical protein